VKGSQAGRDTLSPAAVVRIGRHRLTFSTSTIFGELAMNPTRLALAAATAATLVATPAFADITLTPGDLTLELAGPDTLILSLDVVAGFVDPALGDLSDYGLGFTLNAVDPGDTSVVFSDLTNDSPFAFAPDADEVVTITPEGDGITGVFTLLTPATPATGDVLGTVDFDITAGDLIGEFLLEIDSANTFFNLASGGSASVTALSSFFIPEPASAGLLVLAAGTLLRRRR
jgi:hypothetical protein